MKISLIAARARRGVIGVKNALPWDIAEDREYFRGATYGKTVLMGRRTCESLRGPLPGRRNIVLSRAGDFHPAGFETLRGPEEFLAAFANSAEEIFVMGGAEIYALFLPLAQKMYLTDIDAAFPGDAFFPVFRQSAWREISRREGKTASPPLVFRVLERI